MMEHRSLILAKPEPMPEELLRHVVASLANRDVLNLSAEMGRRLLADRDYHAQRADGAELHEERLRQWLNEAEAEIARLKPDQVAANLQRPAPFSVREAIREAGLDEGLSSAEAIRALAAEVARLRSRVRVEPEDVEARGLTKAHVDAWLEKSRWACLGPGPVGPVWAFDGVRLWRDYQTFLDAQSLRCRACAERHEGKAKPDDSDSIGWSVPAVPTADGSTFWGYTSVPLAAVDWWKALPEVQP